MKGDPQLRCRGEVRFIHPNPELPGPGTTTVRRTKFFTSELEIETVPDVIVRTLIGRKRIINIVVVGVRDFPFCFTSTTLSNFTEFNERS